MDQAAPPRDYERTDGDPRLLAALAAGLVVFIAATPFLLGALFPATARHAGGAGAPQPPAPRLQVTPRADLAALHAREAEELATAGWVDRAHGVVRIPLRRAMEITAARGLPGWPQPPAAASRPR